LRGSGQVDVKVLVWCARGLWLRDNVRVGVKKIGVCKILEFDGSEYMDVKREVGFHK